MKGNGRRLPVIIPNRNGTAPIGRCPAFPHASDDCEAGFAFPATAHAVLLRPQAAWAGVLAGTGGHPADRVSGGRR